jgi:hypothetical protein
LEERYVETSVNFSTNNFLYRGLMKNVVTKGRVLVPNKPGVMEKGPNVISFNSVKVQIHPDVE